MTITQRSFYCPNLIDQIVGFLKTGMPDDGTITHHYGFVRNVGYNLQYLEYLDYNLANIDKQNLHETVKILTRKSFIITGMSIVEAILYFIVKQNGLQAVSSWEKSGKKRQTNKYKDDSKWHKIELQTFIEVTPAIELTMTLDAMIKKVKSKNLLGHYPQVYDDLKKLRQLRNRVHIHAVQHDQDTDFWLFEESELNLMKKALHTVLTKSVFTPTSEQEERIEFLNTSL